MAFPDIQKRNKRPLYVSFTDGKTFNRSDKSDLPRLKKRETGTGKIGPYNLELYVKDKESTVSMYMLVTSF